MLNNQRVYIYIYNIILHNFRCHGNITSSHSSSWSFVHGESSCWNFGVPNLRNFVKHSGGLYEHRVPPQKKWCFMMNFRRQTLPGSPGMTEDRDSNWGTIYGRLKSSHHRLCSRASTPRRADLDGYTVTDEIGTITFWWAVTLWNTILIELDDEKIYRNPQPIWW